MLGLQPHTHQRTFLCLDPLKQCVLRMCVLYLTVHLSHLPGKLDLCGVRELRVKGGGSSFHQQLRSIIHLGDEEDDTASGPRTADLSLTLFDRNCAIQHCFKTINESNVLQRAQRLCYCSTSLFGFLHAQSMSLKQQCNKISDNILQQNINTVQQHKRKTNRNFYLKI